MSSPQQDSIENKSVHPVLASVSNPVEISINRFLSHASPVPSLLTEQGRQTAFDELAHKLAHELEYEPPDAYWSGLWSKPTNKARSSGVTVQLQGSVLRVSKKLSDGGEKGRVFERGWDGSASVPVEPVKGNKRAVHEFSASSRRTLLDRLMSLAPDAWYTAKFLTLTYHDDYPAPKAAKNQLRAFFKRLVRYVASKSRGSSYHPAWFWRMEIKPRLSGARVGQLAPHFHMFLFGCPYIPQHMLLQWWREITGDSSITQVDVKRLDNRRKAMNYVSKYVAKPMDTDRDFEVPTDDHGRSLVSEADPLLDISLYLAAMGRFWGFEGGADIPFDVVKEVIYSPLDNSLLRFVSVLETLYPHLLSRWSFGFKLFEFGEDMSRIKDILYECNWSLSGVDAVE